MACDRKVGNKQVLAALADTTTTNKRDLIALFHQLKAGSLDRTPADPQQVRHALNLVHTHVGRSPALDGDTYRRHSRALAALVPDPPELSVADLRAWQELRRQLPVKIPTLRRSAVVLPTFDDAQHDAWTVLLDLEDSAPGPWVLVGGQMTMLHCYENDWPPVRATTDGDIVVDVWAQRDALQRTHHLLAERAFALEPTTDDRAYRFRRDHVLIDVLVPEGTDRQRRRPAVGAREGLQVDGANLALTLAERVPVVLAGRRGHVRRPNLLGALVIKAAAAVTDSRNPERHREDLVVLGQLALPNLRLLHQQARPHDRRRLRAALRSEQMQPHAACWRHADQPEQVQEALRRLAGAP